MCIRDRLKALKNFRNLLLGNSFAGIEHLDLEHFLSLHVPCDNAYRSALGKLDRVINEIFQNPPELRPVALDGWQIGRITPYQLHLFGGKRIVVERSQLCLLYTSPSPRDS